MFPLNSNMPYIKDNGERDKLGNVIGSGGGGGGSITPDYEHETLEVGISGDWEYFIPMSKRYVGPGIGGYEISTNQGSSSSAAKIDLYSVIYEDGQQIDKTLIQTLVHNGSNSYSDAYLEISYSSSSWSVTLKAPMYNTEGTAYTSPVTWSYNTTVDYVLLLEDPT